MTNAPIDATTTSAWAELESLKAGFTPDLRGWFASDPERVAKLTHDVADLHVDLSKNLVTDEVVAAMEWPIDEATAGRLIVPTTFVYGTDAATTSHEETTRMLAAWVPGAELIALPGVGHAMPLEDPAAVAHLIAQRVG